jgi:molybdate transport system substrate-binding protein
MKRPSRIAMIASAAAVSCLSHMSNAGSAEIRVLASPGVRGVIVELAPQFEAATGHRVVTDFEVIAVLKRRIEAGEAFDLAIIGPAAIDDLIRQGKIVPGSRGPFGRTGLGVVVRKGLPKPDVSSPEALKRTLLEAKSVAHAREGESGIHFRAVMDKLGITDAMKPKLKAYDSAGLRQSLATGEADMAVTGLGPILQMPGADFLGPVPPPLQGYVEFNTSVSASARDPAAVRALVGFLTAPDKASVFKAKGMEPG